VRVSCLAAAAPPNADIVADDKLRILYKLSYNSVAIVALIYGAHCAESPFSVSVAPPPLPLLPLPHSLAYVAVDSIDPRLYETVAACLPHGQLDELARNFSADVVAFGMEVLAVALAVLNASAPQLDRYRDLVVTFFNAALQSETDALVFALHCEKLRCKAGAALLGQHSSAAGADVLAPRYTQPHARIAGRVPFFFPLAEGADVHAALGCLCNFLRAERLIDLRAEDTLCFTLERDSGAATVVAVHSLCYALFPPPYHQRLLGAFIAQLRLESDVAVALPCACEPPADAARSDSDMLCTTVADVNGTRPLSSSSAQSDAALFLPSGGAAGEELRWTELPEWAGRAARARVVALHTQLSTYSDEARFFEERNCRALYDTAKRRMQPHLVAALSGIRAAGTALTGRGDAHEFVRTVLSSGAEMMRMEQAMMADRARLAAFLSYFSNGLRVAAFGGDRMQVGRHFTFTYAGPHTRNWVEWGVNSRPSYGKGIVSAVMHLCNVTELVALERVQTYVAERGGAAVEGLVERSAAELQRNDRGERERKLAALLAACRPLDTTCPATVYLRRTRGLADAPDELIERNPALLFCTEMYGFSAARNKCVRSAGLVVLTADRRAGQRIFLAADGRKSAEVDIVKMSIGSLRDSADNRTYGLVLNEGRDGSARRLTFVAEGPETALSVATAFPQHRVCCTLGCNTLPLLKFPDGTVLVVVCREHDSGEAMQTVAAKVSVLLRRVRTESGGRCAVLNVWPPTEPGIKDYNDVHLAHSGSEGTALVRANIQAQLDKEAAYCSAFASSRAACITEAASPRLPLAHALSALHISPTAQQRKRQLDSGAATESDAKRHAAAAAAELESAIGLYESDE
jgi:hypothetical protein